MCSYLCFLSVYCACCLIPLDKHSGVCPIGVDEILQRIFEKAVMMKLLDMIYSGLQAPLSYVLVKWVAVKLLSMQ